ncbi:hypothetical protein Slin15195_G088560 [Septoria linicola]|uniref:Rhodopsin domain-containing protein n=1 Tax=Septoria linicola TaxID=215465 RepID=A0A9Q9ATI7_9PEZI|nr:hypothetical protein Slin14017_G091210 [Septoria linicola]USW55537.1 hypothetical protein Slin15195_G088560 [Septoria linicola]
MPGNIINLSLDDIAAWPKANYINPTRRKWLPGYASILYTFATISVLVRALSRLRRGQGGGLGVDDIVLFTGWCLLTWFTALAILGSEKYMTSRHMWDVPMTKYEGLAKITWIAELAFLLCGCCVKISVLLFYRRLGDGTYSRLWSWACMGAIIFTGAWSAAFVLALVFNCTPTEAYWRGFSTSYTRDFRCVDTTVNNLLAGILAVTSDLYSVVLPCFLMRKIQLPTAQKIGLYAVFSAGLFVVAAGSVRTYYLYKVGHSSDVSSIVFDVFVWSQLELCMGFMCASAPSLRVFFRTHLQSPLSRLKQTWTWNSVSRNTTHRRGTDSSIEFSSRIRKIDCPYQQVRNEFSHAAKMKTMEPTMTDVTTLVEVLELEYPRKAKVRRESWIPGSQQHQQQKQQQQQSAHSTQNSADTQASGRTGATQTSQDIDLQDNIIVDGYNRSWLNEGFEGDVVRTMNPV